MHYILWLMCHIRHIVVKLEWQCFYVMFKDMNVFLRKQLSFERKMLHLVIRLVYFGYVHITRNYVILAWLDYSKIESWDVVVFLIKILFALTWI